MVRPFLFTAIFLQLFSKKSKNNLHAPKTHKKIIFRNFGMCHKCTEYDKYKWQ